MYVHLYVIYFYVSCDIYFDFPVVKSLSDDTLSLLCIYFTCLKTTNLCRFQFKNHSGHILISSCQDDWVCLCFVICHWWLEVTQDKRGGRRANQRACDITTYVISRLDGWQLWWFYTQNSVGSMQKSDRLLYRPCKNWAVPIVICRCTPTTDIDLVFNFSQQHI